MKKIYLSLILIAALSFSGYGQAVEVNFSQIDFGTLTYGESDSVLVEVTNLLDEEIPVEAPVFFDVYESSPFKVNAYPTSIDASGTASFYVVFEPVHNIAHNSEMVIKTGGNLGSVPVDLLGDCSYSDTYYEGTHNLVDENLEEALHTILAQNYQDYGYGGARDRIFMEIDNQKVNGQGASENTITRRYIGTDAVGYTSRQNAQSSYDLNTEHTFPQGQFNSNLPMKADMHHLFVTDVNANSQRGSYRFGNVVSNVDWSEGGSKRGQQADGEIVFEPRDPQKGPAARAVLYFVVRYQNYGGFLSATQEETLREWSEEFPPDAVERTRNEDIFGFQHNRNPFVDYPQFLDRIYNIRLDQNRPDVGLLATSTQNVDFQQVESNTTETYNLILTNYGVRYILISNLEFTGNSTSSFDFGETFSGNIAIHPGESLSIPVTCFTNSSSDDLEAELHFNTTASESNMVTIPVSASGTTGIFDLGAGRDLRLSPNPAVDRVEFKNLNAPIESIRVYDISGRLCTSLTGNRAELMTSGLNAGVYQVLIKLENGALISRKLIKQ